MGTDSQYEIKGKNWYPRFRNPAVEHDFMLGFNSEALKSGRVGLLIALIVWTGFALFDIRLMEGEMMSRALTFRLLIITPVVLVILAALYSKYATSAYQILLIAALFVIEGSIYYVVRFYDYFAIAQSMGADLPLKEEDGKVIFIFIWLLTIFMATIIIRLSVLQAVVSGLIFIFFTVLSFTTYQPSAIVIMISVPFVFSALVTVWIGSLHVQQYARENYRVSKLLEHSMQQSESLLLNILPPSIAQRLKETPGTIADGFNSVSVLFADIVGFTPLSEMYRPEEMVRMLNRIFSEFDSISRKYKVEKIKTIGDAYMLAAGVPEEQTNHCAVVAHCALDMLSATEHFSDPGGAPIRIRIGIHTGPAIAGVIGDHKFSYDLWGDTVNTASRMESHGDADRIQVTEDIYERLKDEFVFEPRDEIEIKGKGRIKTWWLIGRR